VVAAWAACWLSAVAAWGVEGDAQWIWSPSQPRNEIPAGECYFRKTFQAAAVEEAQLQITADNWFEATLNGQPLGQGADWRAVQVFDIAPLLRPGRNVLAVKVGNTDVSAAGLVARVLIKERGGTYVSHSTDATWKTSLRHAAGWTLASYSDRDWLGATTYGPLGDALPWGNELVIAGQGARFSLPQDFVVERLLQDSEAGSLIAMTFDARGNLYASREGGGIVLITDSDGNGTLDKASEFSNDVRNAQGLLALGSRLFVVGDGPAGPALYRLRDGDRDQRADETVKLVGFRGSRGEHGPHAVRLGPDGMLYVLIGNHARVDATPGPRSPYRLWYEGDAVQPRYEDPRGHAVGIPAPGGTLIRTDAEGSFVETVAGGFRNAYDFAFDADGEIFAYDADMEWDRGAPWYRPTRFNHVTAGAEFGWRSGWAKWPAYYFDSLPAALDMGAGSPTGLEFYDHAAFPAKYRGALFACDWATGRIHAVRFEQQGGSFRGTSEIFLEGRPLNATDVAVGPDGSLYFCTGGRGTDGGVYRIRYEGRDENPPPPATGDLAAALRQPQPTADWALARVAQVRKRLGDAWETQLAGVAADPRQPAEDRLRAVDLLVYFGPRPSADLLQQLAADKHPRLRGKAARLMFAEDDPAIRDCLLALLGDDQPQVRRLACESLMRRGPLPDAEAILPLLADEDRFVRFAARRVLEQTPVEQWGRQVLEADDATAFAVGCSALANVERRAASSRAILERCPAQWDRASEEQRRDLLRLVQLALVHGELAADAVPEACQWLLELYPTTDPLANRELVRLLTRLQAAGAAEKFAAQLRAEIPREDKLMVAACSARLNRGWTPSAKLEVVQFLEEARGFEGGYSVSAYLENFARDFLGKLEPQEKLRLLATGEKWPATALSLLAGLPAEPGRPILDAVRQLDRRVAPQLADSDAHRRLRVGILAVLGRSGDAEAQDHLRRAYRAEPEYRLPIATSLTQRPTEENWPYLVDALKTAEGVSAQEILAALRTVPMRPREAEPYRQAILAGLRLRQQGGVEAAALAAHWSGAEGVARADAPWAEQLAAWQRWYEAKFPDALPARLPVAAAEAKWSYEELLAFVDSPAGKQGDVPRGRDAFAKGRCASCHRWGDRGETMGPDLTTVASRFQRREVLESILYPSHVISDQYASREVRAGGKSYVGLVSERNRGGVTVLLSDGRKVDLAAADIDEIQPSRVSAMPAGLIDDFSLEEVADLFAYLYNGPPPAVAVTGPTPKKR
jgi:putative membrane-bound dehydrogenase-like protein